VAGELRRQVHSIGRRRAWTIWAVGLSVYLLAVFHRTSLGVAGILAAQRFHISASQLATFTVLQLAVYAAMQVPVGVLLDRYGSKVLMVTGLLLMTAGQLWFAFAQTYAAGLGARVLLGAGDAMIFTSLLRLVALWFRVKQAPFITQLTAMVGQLGAIAAASPLAAALHDWGWTRSFATASIAGGLLTIPLLLIVKNSPYAGTSVERIKLRVLIDTLREVWESPGTRVGLWSHFTSQFAPTVFTLLWGFPFLVEGEGLSQSTAARLLIVMTVTAMLAGPLVAQMTARVPYHRSSLVLGIVAAIAAVWAVVLLWPGPAPLWLLVVLVVVMAVGGPGSMVGFDLARTFHAPHRLGRATGIVNVGGFVASLVTMGLIGVVLDRLAPGGPDTYTLGDFRIAMSVQFLMWFVGGIQIWRYRRKGLRLIDETPGAMDALRRGEAILPGLSRDPDDSTPAG
jgi:sugar phosphate permease